MKVRTSIESYSFNLATHPQRGDFTGGTLLVSRVGTIVTIEMMNISHISSSNPYTGNILPLSCAQSGTYGQVKNCFWGIGGVDNMIGAQGQLVCLYYQNSVNPYAMVVRTGPNIGTSFSYSTVL